MGEDSVLVNRCIEGEGEAFDVLVMKYQKPLYSLLYRMLSSHDDAAEVLQKTFVRAFTGLPGFKRKSSFKTWLYRIAVNLAKNVYRERSSTEHVPLECMDIGDGPRALESLIEGENRQLLRRAVGGLPQKQRLTLILRVQEGCAFAEIAGIMRCSIGTAKANYHHAVQKLKGMLAGENPGSGAVGDSVGKKTG